MKRFGAVAGAAERRRSGALETSHGIGWREPLATLFLTATIVNSVYSNPVPRKLLLLDAVRASLAEHPLLRVQAAQIDYDRGALQIASGQFDTVFEGGATESLTNALPTPLTALGYAASSTNGAASTETTVQTNVTASATRLFRNGVSITPSWQLERATDSIALPGGLNSSITGIIVNIPLLRGRGRDVVAARETAAGREIAAARLDLDYLIAQLVSTSASDYWRLVAARRNLGVASMASERASVYVQNTRALIDADHVPRNDINEVSANLAQRSADYISAQQSVVVAAQQVASDMGLGAETMLDGIGEPATDFPTPPENDGPADGPDSLRSYLDYALSHRADYLAAMNRKGQSELLLAAARNGLLPAVNLQIGGGYQGLRAGRSVGDVFVSPFLGVRGPNVLAGITYSLPLGNHAAKGATAEASATLLQSDIRIEETARGISQQISVAVQDVRNSILRVRKTSEAVHLSDTSLSGAREKYRVGVGSIVEILQIEDRLNATMADQVQAQLGYALALTEFRFATGTLVPANQQAPDITADALMTLPHISEVLASKD